MALVLFILPCGLCLASFWLAHLLWAMAFFFFFLLIGVESFSSPQFRVIYVVPYHISHGWLRGFKLKIL
jgi:hypothetical protein